MDKVSESQIASTFVGSVIKEVDDVWPTIYAQLKDTFKKDYDIHIEDEEVAKMNLTFAIIGLELQALKNLFPDRAERIYNKTLDVLGSSGEKPSIKSKVDLYQEKLRESTEQYMRNNYYSPFEEVAVQLIHDWYGDSASQFYVSNTKVVSPVITMMLSGILAHFLGFWKTVQRNLEVVMD